MKSRSLVLALLLAQAIPAHAGDAPVPAKTETRMALTGDFVDLGTNHPGVSRSQAAVEIVNRSPHPIDVRLGEGSGRVEPGQTLFVRIASGEQPLELSSPAAPGDRLEATLGLEKGRAYALGVAWEAVLLGGAPEGSKIEGGAGGAETASGQTQTQTVTKATSSEKSGKSGKVDVGRKKKDR